LLITFYFFIFIFIDQTSEFFIVTVEAKSSQLDDERRYYVEEDLNGLQLVDAYDRLQNDRRTIFDEYEPNYMKRLGVNDPNNAIAHKWVKLAMSEGRLKQIDEESYAFTYKREDLFLNTVWKPGYNWNARPIVLPEWLQPYANTVSSYLKPIINPVIESADKSYKYVLSYATPLNITILSVVIFVTGTTYIGYLAEQGAFDWLDQAQNELNNQIEARYGKFFATCLKFLMGTSVSSDDSGSSPPSSMPPDNT
jgi:hypothetical protein